jgi:hypothetical protein
MSSSKRLHLLRTRHEEMAGGDPAMHVRFSLEAALPR